MLWLSDAQPDFKQRWFFGSRYDRTVLHLPEPSALRTHSSTGPAMMPAGMPTMTPQRWCGPSRRDIAWRPASLPDGVAWCRARWIVRPAWASQRESADDAAPGRSCDDGHHQHQADLEEYRHADEDAQAEKRPRQSFFTATLDQCVPPARLRRRSWPAGGRESRRGQARSRCGP